MPGDRDITFTYTNIFNDVVTGNVEYVNIAPPGITGDYNNNGVVDAADYIVWRKRLGQNVTMANDMTPGTIRAVDYTVWRTNFGRALGAGSALGAAVPEPTASLLVLTGGTTIVIVRRKRQR